MATAKSAGCYAAALSSTSCPCTTSLPAHRSSLPCPPPPSLPPTLISASFERSSAASNRLALLRVKSSSSEEEASGSVQVGEEVFSDLKKKWDALENKYAVILYAAGAIVAVRVSSVIVDSINSVPLLPKLMEVVGLGYTGWFVYRYLLFKSSREELASEIEALKEKITGSDLE